MKLTLFGKSPRSVFALNGTHENSATLALGWAISQSPALLTELASDLVGELIKTDATRIDLQRAGDDGGFTDLEIISASGIHIIIEAKRLWELPGIEQLEKYAERIDKEHRQCGLILSLSAASREYAAGRLPDSVSGVRLAHRSWGDLSATVNKAYSLTARAFEKLWLREFNEHLKGYVSMQDPRDNTVFVVSLSSKPIDKDGSYSWADVVERDRRYFHPVGNKWPVVPPNYIGFRKSGGLLSVHHVESYEVATDLSLINSDWPSTQQDHFVYTLGPPMTPAKEVKNGKIWPSGRYWCAIDTLLSGAFTTVSDARDETNKRLSLSGSSEGA